MAVVVDVAKLALFEKLFQNPAIADMIQLSPDEFEQFVAHVFTCAGYVVEHVARHKFPYGPGVDLNLYAGQIGRRPLARIEVRRYDPAYPLTFDDVAAFVGKLKLAGNIPGFLVTTSSFNGPARKAAALPDSNADLIDGDHLLRYITYIGGSRVRGAFADGPLAPLQPTPPGSLAAADTLAAKTARPPRHKRVLMLGNNKGGVAKTTSALNIGFALSDKHRQRVLLVDMDAQASLTQSLPPPTPKGVDPVPDVATLADYFRGQADLSSLIRPTRFPNLWLIPAHPDMRMLDSGGIARPQAELRFMEDLRLLPSFGPGEMPLPFDWVILDTPPAQTFFTRAAVAATDYVLIPANAEQYAAYGVNGILSTTRTMDALTGPVSTWSNKLLGVTITRWKANAVANVAAGYFEVDLPAQEIHVFRRRIDVDDRIEKAHRETIAGGWRNIFKLVGQPGPAAKAYDEFVKEMLEHVNRREAQAQCDGGRKTGGFLSRP